MVNDDQYTPVKLRNEIIAEIDRIKEQNPFLRTRPDVLKYILHRYVEQQNNNGEGRQNTHRSDPISPNKTQKKEHNGDENYV